MSQVRVLVGTRKGAFVLTSDGTRTRWDVSGPHFAGWEIYHLKGSPADPNRLYASQSSSWFGQLIQRSNDGGKSWEPVGNKFVYDGVPGTHLWYTGRHTPGSSRASGISSHRRPIRTRSTPGSRTPPCSARRTAGRPGRSFLPCANTARRPPGSQVPVECACTRSCL